MSPNTLLDDKSEMSRGVNFISVGYISLVVISGSHVFKDVPNEKTSSAKWELRTFSCSSFLGERAFRLLFVKVRSSCIGLNMDSSCSSMSCVNLSMAFLISSSFCKILRFCYVIILF